MFGEIFLSAAGSGILRHVSLDIFYEVCYNMRDRTNEISPPPKGGIQGALQ